MADPMQQSNIEDVLSSIRRLVSEVPPRPVQPAPAGKLVLTDALRVPGDASAAPAPCAKDAADAPKAKEAPLAPEEAPEVAAEPVQTGDIGAVAEPEAGAEPEAQLALAAEAEPEPEPEADAWEEVSLEERIAELEAAVAGSGGEWEPDGSEVRYHAESFEDLEAMQVVSAPLPEPVDEPAPEPETWVPAEEADAVAAEPQAAPQDDAATIEEEGAEPEQEPEAQAAAEAQDSAPEEPVAAGDAAEDEDSFFAENAGEEAVMDEETLRQLVSDIVREELQGALGERITRNVRKLVRREINRALASRDFD